MKYTIKSLLAALLISTMNFAQIELRVSDVTLDDPSCTTECSAVVDIHMVNEEAISSFEFYLYADPQFNMEMPPLDFQALGGLSAQYGFLIITDGLGYVVGISIDGLILPPSEGVLVQLPIVINPVAGEFAIELPDNSFYAVDGTPLIVTLGEPFFFGEENPGCTDGYALNFDPLATTPDGSCVYPFPGPPASLYWEVDSESITLSWSEDGFDSNQYASGLWLQDLNNDYLEIYLSTDEDVHGYQVDVTTASDSTFALNFGEPLAGLAVDLGWELTSADNGRLLGSFQDSEMIIPAGFEGLLLRIELVTNPGSEFCLALTDPVISGAAGESVSAGTGSPFCLGESAYTTTYNIYRNEFLLAEGVSGLTYTDAMVSEGQEYCYTVSTVAFTESDQSDFVCAQLNSPSEPNTPQNLSAAGGDVFISLDWDTVYDGSSGNRELTEIWISDVTPEYLELSFSTETDITGFSVEITSAPPMDLQFHYGIGGIAYEAGFIILPSNNGAFLAIPGGEIIPANSSGVLIQLAWEMELGPDFCFDITSAAFSNTDWDFYDAAIGAPYCMDGELIPLTYNVYRNGSLIAGDLENSEYTDSGLNPGVTHCYQVSSLNSGFESGLSETVCATTYLPPSQLPIPQNVMAMAGSGFADVHWDSIPADSTGSAVRMWISDYTESYVDISYETSMDISNFILTLGSDAGANIQLQHPTAGIAYDLNYLIIPGGSDTMLALQLGGTDYIPAGSSGLLYRFEWSVNWSAVECAAVTAATIGDLEGLAYDVQPGPALCGDEIQENTVYNVYRDGSLIAESIDNVMYRDDNVDPEATYCYTVTSDNGVSESYPSQAACVTIPQPLDPEYYMVQIPATGSFQLVVIEEAIGLLPGDEVGLFDYAGLLNYGDCSNQQGELLVGSGVWNGDQLAVSSTGSLDYCEFGGAQYSGYVEGNTIAARVWRSADQTEIPAEITVTVGEGIWGENLTVINIEVIETVTQTLSLPPFMINMISLNIIPDDPALETVFGDDVLVVEDQWGGFYVPVFGVDNIGAFSPELGYKVFHEQPEPLVLQIQGSPIDPNHSLWMHPNMNNMMPYLHSQPMLTDNAFGHVHDEILLVSNDQGEYFIPELGIQTMEMMWPGEAYRSVLTGDVPIEYQFPGEDSLGRTVNLAGIEKNRLERTPVFYAPTFTGTSYPLIITEHDQLLAVGDELAAFADGKLVGAVRITDPSAPVLLPAWERVDQYDTRLPGFTPGDAIELKLYQSAANREIDLAADLTENCFGCGFLTFGSIAAGTAVLPESVSFSSPYPNPFNPVTRLEFSLADDGPVSLDIYDLKGRLVEALYSNAYMTSGLYGMNWNAADLASGVYIARLVTADRVLTQKLMLVK